MELLHRISRGIDRASLAFGHAVSWLSLVMVLVVMVNVIMRYVFGTADPKLQEVPVYLHGMLFMLAAAYALRIGGHVRVDVFYGSAGPRKKAMVDLFGHVCFLLPFAVLVVMQSWDYVAASWAVQEGSKESSGIHLVYILKTVIPVFGGILIVQSISEIIHCLRVLLGLKDDETEEAAHGTL